MPAKPRAIALAGLLVGATVWGLIWFPYRALAQVGVGGVLAATLTYGVALACGLVLLRRAWRGVRPTWSLLLIGLAAGGCNLGYVLATLHGEVMRVLLLFYLAPLWTVLLAWRLLGERLHRFGAAVVALSLGGAVVMLWQPRLGLPLPQNGAEWLGLASGFLFALSNVLIRKTAHLSIEIKSLAVFFGVTVIGLVLLATQADRFAPIRGGWSEVIVLVAVLGVALLAVNLAVLYGLAHIPANQAIVIFLFELVVAALSSWLLAGEEMGTKEWLGGAMIVAASVFSGRLGESDSSRINRALAGKRG